MLMCGLSSVFMNGVIVGSPINRIRESFSIANTGESRLRYVCLSVVYLMKAIPWMQNPGIWCTNIVVWERKRISFHQIRDPFINWTLVFEFETITSDSLTYIWIWEAWNARLTNHTIDRHRHGSYKKLWEWPSQPLNVHLVDENE
jgi:hypothetical protein